MVSLPLGSLPVVDGGRRVSLGIGLDGDAPRRSCLTACPADGSGTPLWSARLDPGGAAGAVTLDVPEAVEERALGARCAGGSRPASWTAAAAEAP